MMIPRSNRFAYAVSLFFAGLFFITFLKPRLFAPSYNSFANQIVGDYRDTVLRGDAPHAFPKKIWQTWKTSIAGLGDDDRKPIITWQKLNSRWRYEMLTDNSARSYVEERFRGTAAGDVYLQLRDAILRADLIRYLVLLGDGGVYSDVDTNALKPIDDWIAPELASRVNAVVGVEYDREGHDRWVDWPRDLQFTNWSFLSMPGHPMLNLTVQRVIGNLQTLAWKHGSTLADLTSTHHEVLEITGPSVFTDAIFEYLSTATGETYDWRNVTGLRAPKLIHDVLVLPINAFGSEQSHSGSGKAFAEDAYVQHLFKGSWKGSHPMEPELGKKKDGRQVA